MEPKRSITHPGTKSERVRLLAYAIEGRLDPGTIWAVVLAFIIAIAALGLFLQKETAVGMEECKRQCAASGKQFIYLPSDMSSAEPYAKLGPNCVCRDASSGPQ